MALSKIENDQLLNSGSFVVGNNNITITPIILGGTTTIGVSSGYTIPSDNSISSWDASSSLVPTKLNSNNPITPGSGKTLISYDANGLVTAGGIATTIASSSWVSASCKITTADTASYILPHNIANNYSSSVSSLIGNKQDTIISGGSYNITSAFSANSDTLDGLHSSSFQATLVNNGLYNISSSYSNVAGVANSISANNINNNYSSSVSSLIGSKQDILTNTTYNITAAFATIAGSANSVLPANIANDYSASVSSILGTKQNNLGYTPEDQANKSTNILTDAASTSKYPSVKLIKDYADNLVSGLLDYRGGYPVGTYNNYPIVGPGISGSGANYSIAKGDMWIVSSTGTIAGTAIQVGDSILANCDNPTTSAMDWNTLNSNISYVPEDVANKELGTTLTDSDTKYPCSSVVYHLSSSISSTKQNIITNPVTGTGTTNYISKFTGTSAIGNSLIYDDGTNVGIGTISPSQKLDVSGSIAMTAIGSLLYFKPTSGYASIYTTGTDLRIANGSGNEDRITVLNTGNVGIGTTNPGVKFVNSGAPLSNTSTLGSGVVGSDAILSSDGKYGLYTGVRTTGDVWQQVQRNDTDTSVYNLLLQPNGGNVGIGTTGPYSSLHIDKINTDTQLTIGHLSGGGNSIQSFWSSDVSAYRAAIGTWTYSNPADGSGKLVWNDRISGNYTDILSIYNGNVGIGTTSPNYPLTVYKDYSATDVTAPYNNFTLELENPNQTNNSLHGLGFTTKNSNGGLIATSAVMSRVTNHTNGTTAGQLLFYTTATNNIINERMRIDEDGNVGIGLTNPASLLHVGNVQGVVLSNGNPSTFAKTTVITTGWDTGINDFTEISVPSVSANTSNIRLLVNGNVGIGTISPAKTLHVQGEISSSNLFVNGNINCTNITGAFSINNYVVRERLSGTPDGNKLGFTTSHYPIVGKEMIFRNGVLLASGSAGGEDYTITENTISFVSAPLSGDKLIATYYY